MLTPSVEKQFSRSHCQGLVMVEVTIMLPLMLVLFMATAELGRALYTYNTLTKRVHDGARYLSQNSLRGNLQDVELDQDEIDKLKSLIVYGNTSGSGSTSVEGFSVSNITVTPWDTLYFKVDINYTYRPMFGSRLSLFGLGNDINITIPLNTSVIMRGIN